MGLDAIDTWVLGWGQEEGALSCVPSDFYRWDTGPTGDGSRVPG